MVKSVAMKYVETIAELNEETLNCLQAELLLHQSGDFLVRESAKISGQFILSGRYKEQFKHLLLVDPEGVVNEHRRTLIVPYGFSFRFERKITNSIRFNI
jgi:hypothetical protein